MSLQLLDRSVMCFNKDFKFEIKIIFSLCDLAALR